MPSRFPSLLLCVALVLHTIFSFVGIDRSLLDIFDFRQSQTAISVFYLLKGSPLLAYETPVLGPPWSIPMEFPLYQWLVALLVKLSPLSLDVAGRVVSLIFFYALLIPLWGVLKSVGLSADRRAIVLSLLLLSPLYLFWSRTFLIESTALCFSIASLNAFLQGRKKPDFTAGRNDWILAAIFGSIAALVKITTFFAFGALAGVLLVSDTLIRKTGLRRFLLSSVLAVGIPMILARLWTAFADRLKQLNPMAAGFIDSASLNGWNFGAWADRFNPGTWSVFLDRAPFDIVGHKWVIPACALLIWGIPKRDIRLAVFGFALYLFPMLVFSNLHCVHTYYQYANGIFLIVAVGVVLSSWAVSKSPLRRSLGLLLILAVFFLQGRHYLRHFFDYQRGYTVYHPYPELKKLIAEQTAETDLLWIEGADWSPSIPYYLERRAVMNHRHLPLSDPSLDGALKQISSSNLRLGAALFCGSRRNLSAESLREIVSKLHLNPAKRAETPECRVFF